MTMRYSTGTSYRLQGISFEEVTNGAFSSDASGWTAVNATLASVSGGVGATNCLEITNTTTSNGKAYQDLATLIGQVYEITINVQKGTGAGAKFLIGTQTTEAAIYSSASIADTDWNTTYSYIFRALEYTTRLTLVNDDTSAGTTAKFDSVSVKQVSLGLKDIFAQFYIAIYDSASAYPIQPTNPDTAITDTNLLLFSDNAGGNPLTWRDTLDGDYITKSDAIVPASNVINAGTAKYFRLYRYGDDPLSASTSLPRIDGTVGDDTSSPAPDLILTSVTIVSQAQALNVIRLNIPYQCGG